MKDFLPRVLSLSAGKGIQDGLAGILLLWLARTDQSGYGLFVLGAGVASMLRVGWSLGLDQYALREFSIDQKPRGAILNQMARLKTLMSAMVLAGLMGFGLVKGWDSTQTIVILVIVAGQLLESVADTFYNIFRAEGRQVREGLYRGVSCIIGAAYGAICLYMGLGVVALAFFLMVGNGLKLIAAVAGIVMLKLETAWHKKSDLKIPRDQIQSIVIISGISVLGAFYNFIQIFLLKQFHTLTEVAFFGAAFDMCGAFSSLVSGIVIQAVLFPGMVASTQKADLLAENTSRHLCKLISYGIGVSFFLATLGGWVLSMLYGSKYASSLAPLRIIGPAVLLSFVNNFGVYVLLALRQERRLLAYHSIPAVLSLVAGLLVVPTWGPLGAALNLLGCRMVMSVIILSRLQRELKVFRWSCYKPLIKPLFLAAAIYLSVVWVEADIAALLTLSVYAVFLWKDEKAWPDKA